MTTLYELTQEFRALETALFEAGGEVTPEVDAAFAALGEMEADKVDAYAAFCRSIESYRDACNAEALALREKAAVAARTATRLKARMQEHLESRGLREIKGSIWKAALQKHGGLRALTLLVEPERLPAEFQRVRIEADGDKLRAVAEGATPEDGGPVELTLHGTLVARLESRGQSVRFR